MKVRHLIAKLCKYELDDDIKFQIESDDEKKENISFRDHYKIEKQSLCINFKRDS